MKASVDLEWLMGSFKSGWDLFSSTLCRIWINSSKIGRISQILSLVYWFHSYCHLLISIWLILCFKAIQDISNFLVGAISSTALAIVLDLWFIWISIWFRIQQNITFLIWQKWIKVDFVFENPNSFDVAIYFIWYIHCFSYLSVMRIYLGRLYFKKKSSTYIEYSTLGNWQYHWFIHWIVSPIVLYIGVFLFPFERWRMSILNELQVSLYKICSWSLFASFVHFYAGRSLFRIST